MRDDENYIVFGNSRIEGGQAVGIMVAFCIVLVLVGFAIGVAVSA